MKPPFVVAFYWSGAGKPTCWLSPPPATAQLLPATCFLALPNPLFDTLRDRREARMSGLILRRFCRGRYGKDDLTREVCSGSSRGAALSRDQHNRSSALLVAPHRFWDSVPSTAGYCREDSPRIPTNVPVSASKIRISTTTPGRRSSYTDTST